MLGRLWRGETSFGATFWLYGVLSTSLIWWATWHMGWWLELGRLRYPIILSVLIGSVVLASVAIWRSSSRSGGPRVLVYGARAALVLGWMVVGLVVFGVVVFRPDLNATSHTIQAELQPDPALPYIGFWKTDCGDDFGVAIQKAASNAYFVRFCGPGGCVGKTPFTRTDLVGDPRYRIADRDTIGITLVPGPRPSLRGLSPEGRERVQRSMSRGLMLFKRCK